MRKIQEIACYVFVDNTTFTLKRHIFNLEEILASFVKCYCLFTT